MAGAAVGMEVASDHDTRQGEERFHFRLDARQKGEVNEVKEAEWISYNQQFVQGLCVQFLRRTSGVCQRITLPRLPRVDGDRSEEPGPLTSPAQADGRQEKTDGSLFYSVALSVRRRSVVAGGEGDGQAEGEEDPSGRG